MQHALSFRFRGTAKDPRFDLARIIGGAGALALHLIALMVVLVPMQLPPLTREPVRLPDIEWILREEPKPIPPIPVPVDEQRVVPDPEPQAPVLPPLPIPAPPVDTVTAQPGDLAVAPVTPPATTNVVQAPASGSVVTGAVLRYAAAPAPVYPARALRARLEGTVLLEVLVDVDGQPLEVTIARSSGHRELDRAALRQVLAHWSFQPAIRNGKPVQAIGRVPINFQLQQ